MDIDQQPSRIILSLHADGSAEEWLQVWYGFDQPLRAAIEKHRRGQAMEPGAGREHAFDFAIAIHSMLFDSDGTPLYGSVERALGLADVTHQAPDHPDRICIVLAEDSAGRKILGDHLIQGHGWAPASLSRNSSEFCAADHHRAHTDETGKNLNHTHPEYRQ